ncbi:MAG TPA: 3'-5' exonuclease, partial [Pyrinomonadaceae bacterium]|nr:3'-5' exonuclease [Pyrinomonadaceae bacterium]
SDTTRADGNARGGGSVTLSTVHSAKGLEWDALFLIWMTDGWFPSSRSYDEFEDLEEERRLLYVAATRAKHQLYFISPLSAPRGADGDSPPAISRFLDSIPDTILPRALLS